ncbi:MAG: putative zinc-binding protein [Deltaproteobacteria bacterium]|nr:putative zinc-binding protein [Deltaproteobacteria bacterium]
MSLPSKDRKILVYSCSGCSSAAQMANWIALRLDREGWAEMSCIAGIGGGVASLISKGRGAEVILALDGCPLACVQSCLEREGLRCDHRWDLSRMGVAKKLHEDFDPAQAEEVYRKIVADLKEMSRRREA